MIADTSRIRATLDWMAQDDLETIATHALTCEWKLVRERQSELQPGAAA
jgi:UDP-glucose 4-epimerase